MYVIQTTSFHFRSLTLTGHLTAQQDKACLGTYRFTPAVEMFYEAESAQSRRQPWPASTASFTADMGAGRLSREAEQGWKGPWRIDSFIPAR